MTKSKRAADRPGAVDDIGDQEPELQLRKAMLWDVGDLRFDLQNPRLQTGKEFDIKTEDELIEVLADIAALDELVTSICTNSYQNLEPLIVQGPDEGPFRVLEGNRRLAAIRLIGNPALAEQVEIKIPKKISSNVLQSIKKVLVFRVEKEEDAREFIGFKHINGPQRWDAYAKARYVADWYKNSKGKIGVDEIAAKMGDNNNTLRSYIYAILILDQAEKYKIWSLKDRPPSRGRFPFSHLYTAIGRLEFQDALGLDGDWSSTPPLEPIKKARLKDLGEVLRYLYGSISDSRESLIDSQNPDLKDIGLAIQNESARFILRNRGTLDEARDALKEPISAFHDALVAAKLKLDRAIKLIVKYTRRSSAVDELIDEIYAQGEILKTIKDQRRSKAS